MDSTTVISSSRPPCTLSAWGDADLEAQEFVLSAVLLEDGFRVALPIDTLEGYDVCKPAILKRLVGWIGSGRIWLLCPTPVCTTWSTTQT